MIRFFILFSVAILLTSCEGYINLTGKVISERNEKEIEGVNVELLDIPPRTRYDSISNKEVAEIFLSDKNGIFVVKSKMMGMVKGHPEYRIRLSKEGYLTSEIKITKQLTKKIGLRNDSILIFKLKQQN